MLVACAFGRYSAPVKVQIQTKEVIKEVEVAKKDSDDKKDRHVETVVTKVQHPDGTVETTTKITQDSHAEDKTKEVVTDNRNDVLKSIKTTTYDVSKVTISIATKLQLNDLIATPTYGVIINRPVLGPISLGAFVFSDKQVGLSLGLTF